MKHPLFALSLVALLGVAASFVMTPTAAQANGCGGYVNIAVWGCAPWDHNPPKKGVTPGYRAPPARVVARPAAPAVRAAPPTSSLVNRSSAPTIATGGGNVISHDGGTLIGHDGGSLIGQDGAGMRRK